MTNLDFEPIVRFAAWTDAVQREADISVANLISEVTSDVQERELLSMIVHNESGEISRSRQFAEKKLVSMLLFAGSNKPLTMSLGLCQTKLPSLAAMLACGEERLFAESVTTRNALADFLKESSVRTVEDLLAYDGKRKGHDPRAKEFLRFAREYAKCLNDDQAFNLKEALRHLRENRKILDEYLAAAGEHADRTSREYRALLLMSYNRTPLRILFGAYQRWVHDIHRLSADPLLGLNGPRGIVNAKLPVKNEFLVFHTFARDNPLYFKKLTEPWQKENDWLYYARNGRKFIGSALFKALNRAYREKTGKALKLIPAWQELLDPGISYANYGVGAIQWLESNGKK